MRKNTEIVARKVRNYQWDTRILSLPFENIFSQYDISTRYTSSTRVCLNKKAKHPNWIASLLIQVNNTNSKIYPAYLAKLRSRCGASICGELIDMPSSLNKPS